MTRQQVEDALQIAVDVTIPDLPRALGSAESLGDPAAATRGGFRTGIIDLAREVSFTRIEEPKLKRRWFGGAK